MREQKSKLVNARQQLLPWMLRETDVAQDRSDAQDVATIAMMSSRGVARLHAIFTKSKRKKDAEDDVHTNL